MAHHSPYVTEDISDPILVEPASPAAGAPFIVTVPAGVVWLLEQIGTRFTTSNAIANRYIVIQIFSPGNRRMYSTQGLVAQPASMVWQWGASLNGQASVAVANARVSLSLPAFFIPPLATIKIQALNIDVADQIGFINYNYRQSRLNG